MVPGPARTKSRNCGDRLSKYGKSLGAKAIESRKVKSSKGPPSVKKGLAGFSMEMGDGKGGP